MPDEDYEPLVLAFLREVDRLMSGDIFDRDEWRRDLDAYLSEALRREVDNRTSMLGAQILVMLRRSLGAVD
jgi:hypothetical protein